MLIEKKFAQGPDFGVLLWIAHGHTPAFAGKNPKNCTHKCNESHKHHDRKAMRRGPLVWRYCHVDHLNDCALARFIKLGDFKLFGDQLRDGLVVSHIAEPADVLHPRFGYFALWHDEVGA